MSAITHLAPPQPTHPQAEKALRVIASIATLTILCGLLIQAVLLAIRLYGGLPVTGAQVLVDFAQAITWSFLVCVGIAIGSVVLRARSVLVGFLALVCAPVGLATAKAVQKALGSFVGADLAQPLLSLSTLGLLRGIEYGALAWVLAVLVRREVRGALPFLAAGIVAALVFGGVIGGYTVLVADYRGVAMPAARIASLAFNELAAPIACSFIVYASQVVAANVRALGL